MHFPRMTTRRWMIVVAVVGLAVAAIVEYRVKRRNQAYDAQLGAEYAALERENSIRARMNRVEGPMKLWFGDDPSEAQVHKRRFEAAFWASVDYDCTFRDFFISY